jgi:peptidoglycan hydrolase CwlO-like protein
MDTLRLDSPDLCSTPIVRRHKKKDRKLKEVQSRLKGIEERLESIEQKLEPIQARQKDAPATKIHMGD